MIYEEQISNFCKEFKSAKDKEVIIQKLQSYAEDMSTNHSDKNILEDILAHSLQKNILLLAQGCIELGANPELENGAFVKKAIKAFNYEKINVLTCQNNIDLNKYYNLQSDPILTKENNTDYKNYPWRSSQKRQSAKSKINDPLVVKLRTFKAKNDIILKAIEEGELDTIIKLKNEGVNIHSDNDYYLQLAAKHNQSEIIDFLLKEGSDPSLNKGQALVYAFSKSNFELFKKLVIHGGLKNPDLEKAFGKELKYHNDYLNGEIDKEHKNVEMNNFLYDLHIRYLNSKQDEIQVVETVEEEVKIEEINEKKNVASPFEFLMAAPITLSANKRKKKVEERTIEKKEIISPFDRIKSVKTDDVPEFEIQFKEDNSIKSLHISSEKVIKQLVNLEGKVVTRKELQKKWDEGLILAFTQFDKYSMRKLTAKFLSENKVNFELLNENNISLKRMPLRISKRQWNMSPYTFVCQYLPQLSELLFTQKTSEVTNNLDNLTKKIVELKIDTRLEGFDSKSSIKSDLRQIRHDKEKFEKVSLGRELNGQAVASLKRNNNWNKVK